MPQTFSHVSFRSTAEPPSDFIDGLHPVVSCSMLLAESRIEELKAKRRGGPKKSWVSWSLLDAAGNVTSSHMLCFKTISVKNFSNTENIKQYTRNPFGAVKMDHAHASSPAVGLVLSGGLSMGKVSNTVGVNVAGVQLDAHPRFVLSSGKDAKGARTSLVFYSSDPDARVQLQGVWIEHRELKISFEQVGDAMLEFAPKFKTVYEAHPAGAAVDTAMAGAGAKASQVVASASAAPPAPPVAPPKVRTPAMATRHSGRRISALPPMQIPTRVAQELRKRRHEEDLPILDSPQAMDDAHTDTEFPHGVEESGTESALKRAREESAPAAAAAVSSFSGFEESRFDGSGYDGLCLDDGASEGSQPMLDVPDPTSQDLGLEDSQSLADEPAGGDTPELSSIVARTPSMATPLREGQEDAALPAEDETVPVGAPLSDEAQAQLREMQDVFEVAEARQDKHEIALQDPYVFASLHMPQAKRVAAPSPVDVPQQIALASAPGNPFTFTAFSAPAQTATEVLPSALMLPQGLSPSFASLCSPLKSQWSPLLLANREANASPLMPAFLLAATCPSSPLPHALMTLDWRGQASAGFTPQHATPPCSLSGVPLGLGPGLSPFSVTPIRTPSM
jgi:hypothetical protein